MKEHGLQIHNPVNPADVIQEFNKNTNFVTRFFFYGVEKEIIKILGSVLKKNPHLKHLKESNIFELVTKEELKIIDFYLYTPSRNLKKEKPIFYSMLVAWKVCSLPLPAEIWAKIFFYLKHNQYELHNLIPVCSFFRNIINFTPKLLVNPDYQQAHVEALNITSNAMHVSAILWLERLILITHYKFTSPLQHESFIGVYTVAQNLKSMTLIEKMQGHKHHISALYSFDEWIVSGGTDKTVQIWSKSDYKQIHIIRYHQMPVIAIVGNQDFLITADYAGVIGLWDSKTFKLIDTFTASRGIKSITLSKNILAVNYLFNDYGVDFWDVGILKHVHHIKGKLNSISAIPKNRFALASQHQILILDVEKFKFTDVLPSQSTEGEFESVVVLPNNQLGANFVLKKANKQAHFLYIFDLNLRKVINILESKIQISCLSADGAGNIMVADSAGNFETWHFEPKHQVASTPTLSK